MTSSVTARRLALESTRHRRASRVGTQQRYYLLSHPLTIGGTATDAIAAVPSRRGVLIYPAEGGEIGDYGRRLVVGGTDDTEAALAAFGFASETFDVTGVNA